MRSLRTLTPRNLGFILSFAVATGAASACGGGGADPSTSAASSASSSSTGGMGDSMPCEVDKVLEQKCRACHATALVMGVVVPLVTADDLRAASKTEPSKSVAEVSVERMKSMGAPMPPPPAPKPTTADITALESWVMAGLPAGDCVPKPSPWDVPSTCTTGEHWTQGDATTPLPGELMHPGMACIRCHDAMMAKTIVAGGTVYATGHEPDECDGANMGQVEITDINGQIVTLDVNANGNFLLPGATGKLAFPIKARVLYQGRQRAMNQPQMYADCNDCHTREGKNGAPGRIVLP